MLGNVAENIQCTWRHLISEFRRIRKPRSIAHPADKKNSFPSLPASIRVSASGVVVPAGSARPSQNSLVPMKWFRFKKLAMCWRDSPSASAPT